MRSDPQTKNVAGRGKFAGSALVLIPESVNFFNNIAGRRLAEALRNLGWDVRITSLAGYAGETADLAFLVSLVELFVSCGCSQTARRKLDDLRRHCGSTVMWLLEPTRTPWFENAYRLFRDCGLNILADNALHDQSVTLTEEQRSVYHYLFFGLTESEKHRVRDVPRDDEARVIPWVFVGHNTASRREFARYLVEEVDPGGFLYLTDVLPITEDGPHLKDAAFQRVLQRCRFQLWRAHHSSFYMEGERFRRSALAGCVPLKVVVEDLPGDRVLPFPYLVIRQEELAEQLVSYAFEGLRSAFLEEYCRLPSLEQAVDTFISSVREARPGQFVPKNFQVA